MLEVRQTAEFVAWFRALADSRIRARIDMRIARLANGNFGDAKFFDGIGELRIDAGPGFRIYFVRRGDIMVILLCGGDKSTQRKDIARAIRLAKEGRDDA